MLFLNILEAFLIMQMPFHFALWHLGKKAWLDLLEAMHFARKRGPLKSNVEAFAILMTAISQVKVRKLPYYSSRSTVS